MAPKLKKDLKW
uniref:Uncharacterized protein n=1 Tax=Rhizophora mucronata TaxID=61149 RepID=A0A2P2NYV7_RHIMU